MKNNKYLKPILAVAVLALLVMVMALIYHQLKPETSKGSKEFEVEIVIPGEETAAYTIHTEAEYLSQALEEQNLIKGTAGDYGLFITEVNGHVADDSKQEWWCITKDGKDVYTGVDTTPLADGDHYEITLITGY